MIQHVCRNDTKLEILRFVDVHALDQIHIESQASRSFNVIQAQTSDLAGVRVKENGLSLAVDNGFVAERTVQAVRRCHIRDGWIGCLLKIREICDAVRQFCHTAGAPRERSHEHGSCLSGGLIERSQRRRHGKWGTGDPTEHRSELPAFDDALDHCGGGAEKRAIGPERQFHSAVAGDVTGPVEAQHLDVVGRQYSSQRNRPE